MLLPNTFTDRFHCTKLKTLQLHTYHLINKVDSNSMYLVSVRCRRKCKTLTKTKIKCRFNALCTISIIYKHVFQIEAIWSIFERIVYWYIYKYL